MKNLILLITILIALASCRAPQQIADRKCAKAQAKYERSAYRWGCPLVTGSDTIIKTITLRERHDTTIFVSIEADAKHDSIKVVVHDGIVNSDLSRLDTQYAWATAKVVNGILYLKLFQKEAIIVKTIKDAIKNESKTEYITITKTIKEKTNYLTQWQILQMWAGRILTAILVIALVLYLLLIVRRGHYFVI